MQDRGAEWAAAARRGDFAAAWAVSDAVLAARDPHSRDDPAAPYHLRWVWNGSPPDGRHVLVRCYHGLGDTIQFARYLPALRRLAASVTVEAQPALLPLLERVPGPDRLIPFQPEAPSPPSECDIEIMELAHALRLPPGRPPAPYLDAAPEPRPGVTGVCWEAGAWDAERSIPFALLAPMMRRRRCLALHPGPVRGPVINPGGCPASVADAASWIAGLDLVVTVDTMVAHLSGALGRPTWLLLKSDADWRWGDEATTPWYPSMRILRQERRGDWAPVAARVARDLTARG